MNIYINEEGYLCTEIPTRDHEWYTYPETTKYKVNKEGLFEEYIEWAELKEATYIWIEVLWLEPRTLNALLNINMYSLLTLISTSNEELKQIKWIWNRAIKDIEDSLHLYKKSL